MSETDSDEVRCPLPVVRYEWDADGGGGFPKLEVCGEQLYVSYERDDAILRVGEQETCGTSWKVACLAQHVLLIADYEGSDNFALIPFDRYFLDKVLARFDAQRLSGDSGTERTDG